MPIQFMSISRFFNNIEFITTPKLAFYRFYYQNSSQLPKSVIFL